jgi:competence protein ComEC
MEKKKRIIIEILSLIVIIATILIGGNEKCVYLINQILHSTNPSQKAQNSAVAENGNAIIENKLKIHYIDVGQGDSILIQNENAAILIDGGTGESAGKLTKYLQEQGVKTLNYVIATHPHEDHIGGLDEAINSVKAVEHVWMPKKASSTKAFENLAKAIKGKNLKAEQPSFGQQVQLADMKITALGPMRNTYEQINDYSIVIKLEYKNKNFIFMGDAEKLVEKDIINAGIDVHSDLLKVGHHGSTSSSSVEFLDKVSPKYAVISLGEDNSYGHPHTETLQALKQRNITVYRTDRNGNIVATSDGDSISFEVEKGAKEGYTDTSKATKQPAKN